MPYNYYVICYDLCVIVIIILLFIIVILSFIRAVCHLMQLFLMYQNYDVIYYE